jgi:hypothetical protein
LRRKHDPSFLARNPGKGGSMAPNDNPKEATDPASESLVREKGYESWLEDDRPEEWNCEWCKERTGWDAVGHPPGRHLPQAFTR